MPIPLDSQVLLGLAQAGAATLIALVGVLVARFCQIHMERDVLVALVRGVVQVVIVGAVLGVLLNSAAWTSMLVLAAMIAAASVIAARRASRIPGAALVAFSGIAFGSGTVILLMTLAGVISFTITSLVPIGSIIIANAMTSCGQALERFGAEVESHTGQIEAGLALGAAPARLVMPYAQTAIEASLIPRIDSLRSLGIVWIPGVMAGMILSGVNPVYAALYQFATLAMIFAAAALTSLTTTLLVRQRVFSAADQLILRPREAQ